MVKRIVLVRALSRIEPGPVIIAVAYAGGAAVLVASGLGAVAVWRKIALIGAGAALLYRAMGTLVRPGGTIEVTEATPEPEQTRQASAVEEETLEARVAQEQRDNVDEASYESFPASDPPGY